MAEVVALARGGAHSDAKGNVVCDLDGVVYLADTPVPGAGRALQDLESRGYRVVFATNAATRTVEQVAARIRALTGFQADPARVVTSAVAAAGMLASSDGPLLVVGEEGLIETLEEAGFAVTGDPDSALAVVIGLHRQLTYGALRAATRAGLRGVRLVATNTDPTFPTESGLWPGAGAIVAAVETATGRRAEVAGKPHPPMREAIRRALGPGPTWVVGDRPETDLAMASAEGWHPVLVLTGVVSEPAGVPAGLVPQHVLDSVADLPGLLP